MPSWSFISSAIPFLFSATQLVSVARALNGTNLDNDGRQEYGFCFNDGDSSCQLASYDLAAVWAQMVGQLLLWLLWLLLWLCGAMVAWAHIIIPYVATGCTFLCPQA